jgi:hypothetical protein
MTLTSSPRLPIMTILAVNTPMACDGVVQAPGCPEEDPTGRVAHGGWAVNYFDEEMMGRSQTHEIFGGHWLYDEGLDCVEAVPAARGVAAAHGVSFLTSRPP